MLFRKGWRTRLAICTRTGGTYASDLPAVTAPKRACAVAKRSKRPGNAAT